MSVRTRNVPYVRDGEHDEGWNHNNHYHDLLLKAVPYGCQRALDVGCGLGFISMIAVLHHLPFERALTKAKNLLNSAA
jgi:hypothetical protein